METGNDLSPLISEGDLNTSPRREAWTAGRLDAETRLLLEEDACYFLHQSLSSPCLNVLKKCEGAYIEDWQGQRNLDFHGNYVHQVGFGNPAIIEAIKAQLDELSLGNVIGLMPPLTLNKQELDTAFDILEACLAEIA